MNLIKRIFVVLGLTLLGILVLLILGVILFVFISPQFGSSPSRSQRAEYARTGYYENGKFQNPIPTPMNPDLVKVIRERLNGQVERTPDGPLPVRSLDSARLAESPDTLTRLSWFGHSAFLLELDGKKILLDPMFGQYAAPLKGLGPKRYNEELPIEPEQLPAIDAVIFSHDHYDHLDYGSIRKLKGKADVFFVPLGVDNHLRGWGVPEEKIRVLSWWEDMEWDGIRLVCTPARHFSGRGFTDRAATLWCSWVIEGKRDKVYFSGDSGYGPHFQEIGERFGPFDIALMECGQYNEEWKNIHMMPEETARAAVDVGGKLLLPIHWGAFSLALHAWTDPVQRVSRKAEELGIPITTPRIGETVVLGEDPPKDRWW